MNSPQEFQMNGLDHDLRSLSSTPTPKTEGFAAKLRQTIYSTNKKSDGVRPSSSLSSKQIADLSPSSQELILRTVDAIRMEDSSAAIETLDESRHLLKSTFDEFKREQDEYRRQLEEIVHYREAAMQRPIENTIPLSLLLKQKHDIHALADLRPNSSMNPTYQAYFTALLTDAHNQQQHPSDKAAVAKYIRKRERRKRAEENKHSHQLNNETIEQKTVELMQRVEGIDIKLEHERQRQNEALRARMNEKKAKIKNIEEANEILEQANEADQLRQQAERAQREKVESRLSAIRQQQNRSPTNLIHVQSRGRNEDDDNGEDTTLNDEEKRRTKQSIELLNKDDQHRTRSKAAEERAAIYEDDHHNRATNIDI